MSIAGGGLPHLSPDGPRYFGGTFLPFNALRPPRTTLRRPTTAMDSESIPTCCGIQLGSSWPIRVWILGRCNTISATRTSSIRFDIANFLPSGSAISGRTKERLADTRWPSFTNVTASSATFAERSSAAAAHCPTRRRGRYDRRRRRRYRGIYGMSNWSSHNQ